MGKETVELENGEEWNPTWEDNGTWQPTIAERVKASLGQIGCASPEKRNALNIVLGLPPDADEFETLEGLGAPLKREEAGAHAGHIELTNQVAAAAGFRVVWREHGAVIERAGDPGSWVNMIGHLDGAKSMRDEKEMVSTARSVRKWIRDEVARHEEMAILRKGELSEVDESFAQFS